MFPYSSGSKGTAAKIKLASGPFLVSFFSHVSSGSSGFFAYFFMLSQIFCAFLQVCALFFLAIKSDFLWSRERHNTLSSFRTHITSPRLWHNFQRRNGENYSWSPPAESWSLAANLHLRILKLPLPLNLLSDVSSFSSALKHILTVSWSIVMCTHWFCFSRSRMHKCGRDIQIHVDPS